MGKSANDLVGMTIVDEIKAKAIIRARNFVITANPLMTLFSLSTPAAPSAMPLASCARKYLFLSRDSQRHGISVYKDAVKVND